MEGISPAAGWAHGSWCHPMPRVLLVGRSCTFGLSPLTPKRFNKVQANSLYQWERMLRCLRSLSCRKQSICMIFVTRGHCRSQAGDTAAAGDTEDLPRAPLAWGEHGDAASRSCSRLVSFLHHALCREDDVCSLVPGTSVWVNPLQGGDEDFTSQQHPILMAMVRCCLAGE